MIFQTHNLLPGFTAKENLDIAVELSKQRKIEPSRSISILKSLGIDRPHTRIDKLSTGEQQRVAVARSLVTEPALVLADEPTASLDRAAADRLIEDLVAMTRETGTTLVAVSHDMHLIARMDRVLTVTDGALSADEVPA